LQLLGSPNFMKIDPTDKLEIERRLAAQRDYTPTKFRFERIQL
jgi:hypothetical protein